MSHEENVWKHLLGNNLHFIFKENHDFSKDGRHKNYEFLIFHPSFCFSLATGVPYSDLHFSHFLLLLLFKIQVLVKKQENKPLKPQRILFSSLLGLGSWEHSENVPGIKSIMQLSICPVECENNLFCYWPAGQGLLRNQTVVSTTHGLGASDELTCGTFMFWAFFFW